jgi:alpha-beta hydrolase superfamily lysophospholipase
MIPSTYTWSGGTEALLRFGPSTGPIVIAAMPLFEEANRTRAFVVTILRALAERGIASALPDLPGTGDSLIATEGASLGDWQAAFASAARSCAEHPVVHGFALRGGALVDSQAVLASRYHLAPSHGAVLVRDLLRTRLAAAKESGEPFDPTAIALPGPPILLAGNHVDRNLLTDLTAASPAAAGPVRIARLQTDAQHADIKFAAAPLWRRAEPGNDSVLAALLAGDITAWITACAA